MENERMNKVIFVLCIIVNVAKGQCPQGWLHHEESCYLLHSKDKYSWIDSQVLCSGHGAYLVHIDDNSENTFVKGLIMQNLSGVNDANVWIGASDDVVEGQYQWYGNDQPLTFTDWGPGEPNSVPLHIDEDCLAYWASYSWKWADYNCHSPCYYVCEKARLNTPCVHTAGMHLAA